jgi:hypothetical protein
MFLLAFIVGIIGGTYGIGGGGFIGIILKGNMCPKGGSKDLGGNYHLSGLSQIVIDYQRCPPE